VKGMSLLELHRVRKSYGYDENKIDAVSNVDLFIEEGSFVAIVGTSGSGKSTLLHIMGGLNKPQKGTVLLEGKSIYEMRDDQLSRFRRRRIGFVFQFFNLIGNLNVYENIVLPIHLDHLKENQEYIDEILNTLNLEDKKEAFVKELSGGQQ
jgi:ABC-type antimicrobial peptide transport system, ATPase component